MVNNMNNDIIIRRFTAEDKTTIQLFFDNMGEKSAAFFNVNHGNEKRVMGYFTGETKNHIFFAAMKEGVCVGLMFIWDIDRAVPWFGIAVADDFQGQGIGTGMIDYLKGYLVENNYGGLLLRTHTENVSAQKLYEKCGFERIGVHPSGEYLYILRPEKRQKNESKC